MSINIVMPQIRNMVFQGIFLRLFLTFPNAEAMSKVVRRSANTEIFEIDLNIFSEIIEVNAKICRGITRTIKRTNIASEKA